MTSMSVPVVRLVVRTPEPTAAGTAPDFDRVPYSDAELAVGGYAFLPRHVAVPEPSPWQRTATIAPANLQKIICPRNTAT